MYYSINLLESGMVVEFVEIIDFFRLSKLELLSLYSYG